MELQRLLKNTISHEVGESLRKISPRLRSIMLYSPPLLLLLGIFSLNSLGT
jgi:hypothetical protein